MTPVSPYDLVYPQGYPLPCPWASSAIPVINSSDINGDGCGTVLSTLCRAMGPMSLSAHHQSLTVR